MLPALLFFIAMVAFYPEVGARSAAVGLPAAADEPAAVPPAVPADDLLGPARKRRPAAVHAINERIDKAWQRHRGAPLTHRARLAIALVLLVVCMFLAGRFGLVALIANGYRALAYLMLAVFVLPLATIGVGPHPQVAQIPQHARRR